MGKKNVGPKTVQEAKALGYCIVSRRHRLAARLTPNWRETLAATHPNGMDWVNRLGPRHAADQFRRCCVMKDWITIPSTWIDVLGNSSGGPTEYMP